MMLFKNTIVSNSVVTLLIRIVGVATLFGLSLLMTNTISEEQVGYYEFARVVLLTIATFGLLGTDQSILFFAGKLEASHHKEQLSTVYFKMLQIILIASVAVLSIYILIPSAFFIKIGVKENFVQILTYCMYILPCYCITILNTEAIRAYHRVIVSEWFRNIIKYIPLAIGVVAIRNGWFPEATLVRWYVLGFAVLGAISTAVVLFLINKNERSTSPSVFTTQEIAKLSYPMAISSFYTFLLMTIDVFLLGQYYDAHYVAYYAIAMKVMSVLSLVIVAINVNFAPQTAQIHAQNDRFAMQQTARKASKYIALINVLIGAVLLIGAPNILHFFGKNYTEALAAYYILIGTQIVVSTFGLVPTYLNMTEKQHLFHKIMGIAVVINICMNVFLIPKYQLIGAAISYAVTVLFWNICAAYFAYKIDKVHLTLWR